MRPAAITFDLDDTLLDQAGLSRAIANVCGALAAAGGLDADRLLAANAAAWGDYWPSVESAWVSGSLDRRTLVSEAWGRTLRACGVVDASLVELAIAVEREELRSAYRLFDDARPAVAAARADGCAVALVTNGESATQREKIDVLGIEGWFDAIVVSGEVGAGKPDPAPFCAALAALGAAPADAWHIGDSLRSDVAGANAAGLTSVWLNRRAVERVAGDPVPDREVVSLDGLSAAAPPGPRG